jgi:spore germination protein GerM
MMFGSIEAVAQTNDTTTIKVFFHNEKFNPNQEDCTKVYPTTRTIPRTKTVARAALEELFKGTTEEERKKEFWSFPSEDTKDIIKGLNVKGGVAYVNFKKIVFEKLGNTTTSCGGGFYSSIEATLKQFPTIQKVIYAVEGNANEFYEWVQVGECPHGRNCDRRNFVGGP